MAGKIGRKALATRRGVLAGGAALAVGLKAPAILAQTRAPLRLGVLNTFSGAGAYPGECNFRGMSLYLDRIGWTIAGRKVELIKEDDQFNAQVGLQKARKFVESDHVDMIVGPAASNVAIALINYVKESKAFLVVSGAGTDSITWERVPYMFRTSLSTWQLCHPIAEWVMTNLAKEVVLAASDYAGGRDVLREFKVSYEAKGGKVLKEIYPPLGTTDFSPYLLDIRSINPPATYNFFPGSDSIRYMQQYAEFGLKARLVGFAGLADATTVDAEGRAALGVITSTIYSEMIDSPENKAFVAAYRPKYKEWTNSYADYGVVAAQAIEETLKATDGDTTNKDRLAEAMTKVSFTAPRGPFRFDPVTHNPIQNVYVCEEKEIDGRIATAIIGTVNNVQAPPTKDG